MSFGSHGAYLEITAASELAGAVDELLTDRSRAAELGRRAAKCAESSRGATERAIAVIREVAAGACPMFGRSWQRVSFFGRCLWLGARWARGSVAAIRAGSAA